MPGYISSEKTLKAGDVYVVSVNDAFVMKAWGKQLDPEKKSKVRLSSLARTPPDLAPLLPLSPVPACET